MAELYIYGDVGYEVNAAQFVADLDALDPQEPLTVRISSAGGAVWDGFTIANRIRGHAGQSTAVIDGLAASMATIIAIAADRVVMAEDAFFMIHNPQTPGITGDADELRDAADRMDQVAESMLNAYARRASLTRDEIIAWMDAETWLSAEQALEAGFVDEISCRPTAGRSSWMRFQPPARCLLHTLAFYGWGVFCTRLTWEVSL